MNDIKTTLKSYMISFPGSVSGFLETISEIFIVLGKEWDEHGKKEWAKIFIESGEQLITISNNLNKIKNEFDLEQKKEEPLSTSEAITAIQTYIEKLKK